MSFHCCRSVLAIASLLVWWGLEPCRAAITFLGPTPYLSEADSPFPVDGSNPNFYLEDFEDGQLNTPGILQPLNPAFGTAFWGHVMGPGEATSSVDADDSVIDGSGTGGHSFQSGSFIVSPDIPQRNQASIEFNFNSNVLGFVPNAFGFVWTDGPPGIAIGNGLALNFLIYDTTGARSAVQIRPMVPADRHGQTVNDLFLGVIANAGIESIDIFAVYRGEAGAMPYIQIDHVQYGRLPVPEPGSMLVFVELLILWSARRCANGRMC